MPYSVQSLILDDFLHIQHNCLYILAYNSQSKRAQERCVGISAKGQLEENSAISLDLSAATIPLHTITVDEANIHFCSAVLRGRPESNPTRLPPWHVPFFNEESWDLHHSYLTLGDSEATDHQEKRGDSRPSYFSFSLIFHQLERKKIGVPQGTVQAVTMLNRYTNNTQPSKWQTFTTWNSAGRRSC